MDIRKGNLQQFTPAAKPFASGIEQIYEDTSQRFWKVEELFYYLIISLSLAITAGDVHAIPFYSFVHLVEESLDRTISVFGFVLSIVV